jgi:hypothetical protein
MLPPVPPGSIPVVSVNNTTAVSFFLQSGLAKDSVRMETSDLNLKTLKDVACNFVDRKVRAVNSGRKRWLAAEQAVTIGAASSAPLHQQQSHY